MPKMKALKRHTYGGRPRNKGDVFDVEGRYVLFQKASGNAVDYVAGSDDAAEKSVELDSKNMQATVAAETHAAVVDETPPPVVAVPGADRQKRAYRRKDLQSSQVANTALSPAGATEAAGKAAAVAVAGTRRADAQLSAGPIPGGHPSPSAAPVEVAVPVDGDPAHLTSATLPPPPPPTPVTEPWPPAEAPSPLEAAQAEAKAKALYDAEARIAANRASS